MTETEKPTIKSIAILGGTGREGKGLAYRWGRAGYTILIGSRQEEKAQAAVEAIQAVEGFSGTIKGMTNAEACSQCDLAVLSVPYSAHISLLEEMKPYLLGKILVDVTVPTLSPKVTKVQMPPEGSATQEAKRILGEGVEVVAAFQNISYEHLLGDGPVDCDVLVTGSSKAARWTVISLIEEAGLVAWDAGPIENSVVVEGMTAVLRGINRQYGVNSSGIRITGIKK